MFGPDLVGLTVAVWNIEGWCFSAVCRGLKHWINSRWIRALNVNFSIFCALLYRTSLRDQVMTDWWIWIMKDRWDQTVNFNNVMQFQYISLNLNKYLSHAHEIQLWKIETDQSRVVQATHSLRLIYLRSSPHILSPFVILLCWEPGLLWMTVTLSIILCNGTTYWT